MWVRAVWNENGIEEEGTVPASWIRNGMVYWPISKNAAKDMQDGKVPTSSWKMFPLIKEKFKSARRKECELYEFTTSAETENESEEEDRNVQRQRKKRILEDFYTGDDSDELGKSKKRLYALEDDKHKKKAQNDLSKDLPKPPRKHSKPLPDDSPDDSDCAMSSRKESPEEKVMSPRRSPRKFIREIGGNLKWPITNRCQQGSGKSLQVLTSKESSSRSSRDSSPVEEESQPRRSPRKSTPHRQGGSSSGKSLSFPMSKESCSRSIRDASPVEEESQPRRSPRKSTPHRQGGSSSGKSLSFPMSKESCSRSIRDASPVEEESQPRRSPRKSTPHRQGGSSSGKSLSFPMSKESSSRSSRDASPVEEESQPRRSPRKSTPHRKGSGKSSPRKLGPALRIGDTISSGKKSPYPMSQERFQRKVITILAEMKMDLEELKERSHLGLPGDVKDLPLQARSIEEFEDINRSLKTPEDCRKLVRALSRVGGSSVGENGRKVMLKLMSYEAMAGYSIKGRKGKKALGTLQIFQVIRDAIIQTMACTEAQADAAISAVLKYAPDRRGGGGRKRDEA